MPVFQGAALQKGYGLGGILGGLLRSAVPLLKQGAKAIGKTALKSGIGLAQDALTGQNFKSAAKKRLKEAGKSLKNQAAQRMSGEGRRYGNNRRNRKRRGGAGGGGGVSRKSIKRKHKEVSFSSRPGKRPRRSHDIFD